MEKWREIKDRLDETQTMFLLPGSIGYCFYLHQRVQYLLGSDRDKADKLAEILYAVVKEFNPSGDVFSAALFRTLFRFRFSEEGAEDKTQSFLLLTSPPREPVQ